MAGDEYEDQHDEAEFADDGNEGRGGRKSKGVYVSGFCSNFICLFPGVFHLIGHFGPLRHALSTSPHPRNFEPKPLKL
jgi:hypothetical protein